METKIKQWFAHEDTLTVECVPHDGGEEFAVTFDSADEAINDIATLSYCNDVFF